MIIVHKSTLRVTIQGYSEIGHDRNMILGDCMGYYNPYSKKKLSSDQLRIRLEQSTGDDLLSLLCYSIGDFAVVRVSDATVRIYCSVASSGLFWTESGETLHFSAYEKEIYDRCKSLTLKSTWLLNLLDLGSFNSISGCTFFGEVQRIPGGHYLDINLGSEQFLHNYAVKAYEDLPDRSFQMPIQRQQFREAIEATMELITEDSKGPIYLLFSGGIDSVAMLSALRNSGCQFTAVNISDFTPLIGIVKSFERLLSSDPRICFLHINTYKPSCESADASYISNSVKRFFGFDVITHPFSSFIKYLEDNDIRNATVLYGDGFDAMYTLRMTGSSHNVGLRPYHAYIAHIFKRFYLSDFYLRLVASQSNGLLFKFLRNTFFDSGQVDFASAMIAVPDGYDVPPYLYEIPNTGHYSDEDIKRLFLTPRQEEMIRPLFDEDNLEKYSDSSYLNYLVRIAMWFGHRSGGISLYRDVGSCAGWRLIPVAFEPPVASLFVKLRIDSIKDMFLIKRGLFNYVNDNLAAYGTTYQKLARKAEVSPNFDIRWWRTQESRIWRYMYALKDEFTSVASRMKPATAPLSPHPASHHILDTEQSLILGFRDQYYSFLELLEPSPLKDTLLEYYGCFEGNDASCPHVSRITCTIVYLNQFLGKLAVK